jgi:hypothetical protein
MDRKEAGEKRLVWDYDGSDENCPGYKVEYEDGYAFWSPKDTFEKAYRRIEGLTFGQAIEALKRGKKVARRGWNGKGMWLKLANQNLTGVDRNAFSDIDFEDDGRWAVLPCICMKTATREMLPGWLASQTDMLAEDWEILH